MTHKNLSVFIQKCLLGLVFALVLGPTAASAQPAAPTEKYIFYWGQMQADLLSQKQFQTTLSISYNNFRKAILSQPSIWNGKTLIREFDFNVRDMVAKCRPDRDVYLTDIAAITKKISQNVKAGDTVWVRNIPLAPQVVGAIAVVLQETERKTTPEVSWDFSPNRYSDRMKRLDALRWGPYLGTHMTERKEFFTMNELEETFRAIPVVAYKPDSVREELRLAIRMSDELSEMVETSFVVNLSTFQQDLQKALKPYLHLIGPGTELSFEFATKGIAPYELRMSIQVVKDDDPRLALRWGKSTQPVHVEWGAFVGNYILYLQAFEQANGGKLYTDRPSLLRLAKQAPTTFPFNEGDYFERRKQMANMLSSRPVLRVGDKEIPSYSFVIVHEGVEYPVGASELIPNALKEKLMVEGVSSKTSQKVYGLTIKQIKTDTNYNFDPIQFHVYVPAL